MSKSPGHRRWPNHKVEEHPVAQRLQVLLGAEVVADSDHVLELEEDGHPPRYYFPRADVSERSVERTATTTQCPFKGTASYFAIHAGGRRLEDAAWSYEQPFDEHVRLKDRVAFDGDSFPGLQIREA